MPRIHTMLPEKSFEAYRNRRINHVLQQSNKITVQDMMNLQSDNFNLKASECVPVFLKHLDSTKLTTDELTAFQILKSWNFVNDKESLGASYFEAWWTNLMPMIWDEMNDQKYSLAIPTQYTTIKLIKENPELVFFDIKSTPEGDCKRRSAKVVFVRRRGYQKMDRQAGRSR